jgi:hypothetical protein
LGERVVDELIEAEAGTLRRSGQLGMKRLGHAEEQAAAVPAGTLASPGRGLLRSLCGLHQIPV